ncbi:MAG TPA: DNA ligase D [Gaiellaceae bacterium]|nr:DNA ligase D [Gaiellaceae bacterium]
MPLSEYRRKRDPRRTPEPFGGRSENGEPVFVVQRHAARRLHYDFRLERGGALASWAVPKGIPLAAGERHLAVHVEDHPLEYATFEGEIPAGEYGAGTVEIWDRGTYEVLEEKRNGGLTVRLRGERLDGVWTLIPAHLDGDPKNWLLIRKDASETGSTRYLPMLPTTVERLPTGDEWVFEPKWDGFRALVALTGGVARLTSRNGKDLTERFAPVAKAVPGAVRTPSAVLDGEVCALTPQGRSDFSLLQQGSGVLALVLFDALEIDGEPLVDLPLTERRSRLEQLVAPASHVLVSPVFDDGGALERAAREQGLEGVVAKRVDSTYQSGKRSRDWRKVKVREEQELVIAGYTKGQGRRSGAMGALVLGVREAGELRWAGNVGSGFTDAELETLRQRLEPLRRPTSPFAETPRMPRIRKGDVQWVEPELVAEVTFAEWTSEGRLRAPVYLGLREDKPADEVRREHVPIEPELRRGRRTLKLSNLDKPFWPDEGITKGDLLAYYRDVAPVLVPHLRDRPFTMKRYPDGWQGKHFFQKDAPSHMPEWIPRAPFPATTREGETRTIDYAIVNDDLALLWMVNMGCIDMNAWSSRAEKPERPDWVMFDLDPSDDVGFPEVVEVALLVREALELVELTSFAKTSGSRGIHVQVPVARRHGYDDVREFAGIVAGALARAHPGLVTTEWQKKKRRGVLVDANQNGPGKTTASVYSVRPRPGATVSTPLRWDEVRAGLDPTAFTMEVVLDRVARDGDLFAGVLGGKQSLTAALRALR